MTQNDILIYMSKEIVAEIEKAIEEAQKAKILREEQEASKREAESRGQKAREKALIAQNEARLRATGVVELFEGLRDSKTLTLFKADDPATADDPAKILWGNSDKTVIHIEFDRYILDGYVPNPDGEDGGPTRCKFIEATISRNGNLQINEHEMKPGEKLGDVVRDEILMLKGLKE